jgi:hypothetical protein
MLLAFIGRFISLFVCLPVVRVDSPCCAGLCFVCLDLLCNAAFCSAVVSLALVRVVQFCCALSCLRCFALLHFALRLCLCLLSLPFF